MGTVQVSYLATSLHGCLVTARGLSFKMDVSWAAGRSSPRVSVTISGMNPSYLHLHGSMQAVALIEPPGVRPLQKPTTGET